jgi:hypothetical protein
MIRKKSVGRMGNTGGILGHEGQGTWGSPSSGVVNSSLNYDNKLFSKLCNNARIIKIRIQYKEFKQ